MLIQFYFNSSTAQCRPRPSNDSRHGSKEPVFQCGAREKEQELECCRVWSDILLRQRHRDTHSCHGDTYDHASVFFVLCDLTESFTAVLLLVSEHLVYFCLLFFFLWHFSSPLFLSAIFFIIISGLKNKDYFFWPHWVSSSSPQKKIALYFWELYLCVRMKYIYIFN